MSDNHIYINTGGLNFVTFSMHHPEENEEKKNPNKTATVMVRKEAIPFSFCYVWNVRIYLFHVHNTGNNFN